MATKLRYVLSTTMFLITFSILGQNNFFTKVENNQTSKSNKSLKSIDTETFFEFDYKALSTALNKSSNSKTSNIIVSFPNVDGQSETYKIEESSVFHPDLQAKYPEIKSYVGYGIDSPTAYLRFSLSPYKGLSGIILGKEKTILFEPNTGNYNQIRVLNKSSLEKKEGFKCLTENTLLENTLKSNLNLKDADDSQKRTYKLALSVTGEYASFHGGTLALVNAAIASTITNINAVFEKEFNTSLQLIGTNDSVIYLNSGTDPYSTNSSYNNELQSTLDAVILDANYDIGHLLSATGYDGNSGYIGCVCNSGNKGSGYSSDDSPSGFNFDIDLVAHEMGHQFGANHTWTDDGNPLTNNNERSNTQMEPGSGSTIMGYAGITGSPNVQANSDPYFHAISLDQITTYIKSTSCASITNTGNTTPTVDAGNNLILPIETPFKLVGTGGDVDGDIITYCWEQINENNAATIYPNPSSIDNNSVLFRSYPPTTNNIRYFPNLLDLKFGLNATQWEKIPSVSRTADFRLTVRDNKTGGANNTHDDMQVTFNPAYGPFEITSQNTSGILWTSGSTETITWNVNNTNTLSGASNVNILLSTDGGLSYSEIVNNITNDGSYAITVPNTPAPYCRIMIEPTNNNFFAINSEDFAIDYTINKTCTQYASSSSLGIGITDNSGTFTQSHSINIPTSSTISDLNIGVNITHPYIGDLALAVESPNSTQILLKASTDCDEEDNLIGTFNDDAIAYNCSNSASNIASKSLRELLSGFDGEDTSGNWTIHLGDFGAGDIGTLNSWFVEICETTETLLSNNTFDLTNFNVFPNPNNGEFQIKLNNSASNEIKVTVFDLRGRTIYSNSYKNDNGNYDEKITLNNVQSGMYILNITDGIKETSKKIIIE